MGEAENDAAKTIVLSQARSLTDSIRVQVEAAPAAAGDERCKDHSWVVTASKLSLEANSLTLQLLIALVEREAPARLAAAGTIGGVTAGVIIGIVEAVKHFIP